MKFKQFTLPVSPNISKATMMNPWLITGFVDIKGYPQYCEK